MTIYLEPNLLTLEAADDAATHLRYLAESGARLIVVSGERLPDWDALDVSALDYAVSAEDARRGDWWVTADADDCARRPLQGVRTVLVGATPSPDARAPRCDVVARDLRGAVLEILSLEAMPDLAGVTAAR